jgi:EmrB/QacA subfamily drug resistance transporter
MLAVAMGVFLATIDGSIVNVSLPTMVGALDTDFATIQWVVLAYLLTITTLQTIVGRLADMYGKKRLYTTGFVVFTAGSLLCGLAPTVGWLIGFRVLQGVGAALILALGLAILTEAFPSSERGRALGIGGAIVSIGIVTGPTLGGFILERLSWHWVFFVNVPIGIAGTLLAMRHVPATLPRGGQRFDLGGAATLSISLLSLLLGLTNGQQQGFGDSLTLGLLAVSVLSLALFVTIELRHPQPIIDPHLFSNRLFTVNLVTGLIVFIGLGSGVLIPFYLENVLGYGVQSVRLLLAVLPIALGITAPISGSLSDRFGSRPITVAGLAVTVIGYLTLSTLQTDTTAVGFMLRYLPVGIGVGLFQSPNNSAIMGSVPGERLGIASSLLATTRSLGQTVGIAALGALWATLVFRAAGGIVPGGATAASAAAQVTALQITSRVIAGLVFAALLLAVWTWRQERLERREALGVAAESVA